MSRMILTYYCLSSVRGYACGRPGHSSSLTVSVRDSPSALESPPQHPPSPQGQGRATGAACHHPPTA